MPSSHWKFISDTIQIVRDVQPKTILDIGVGCGKWGFLCREYLDVYAGRWKKEDWKTKIDGIEIYKPYLKNIYFYDKIFIGDAYKLIDKVPDYDLILVVDVLEHFSKEKGGIFLRKAINKAKTLILSVPLGNKFKYNFKAWDNRYESHLSGWNVDELKEYPYFEGFKVDSITLSDNRKLEVGLFVYSKSGYEK